MIFQISTFFIFCSVLSIYYILYGMPYRIFLSNPFGLIIVKIGCCIYPFLRDYGLIVVK